MLVRSAEAMAFGDSVDHSGATTSHLMGMLLADLETQAELAGEIIRRGRPRQLVRFSREQVREQVARVTQVLAVLEERLDEASTHFGRVVRVHEAMQGILRAHEGISRRLAEWNLRRLETTDAGYSLTALCEAVLGASAEELESVIETRILVPPVRAAALSTDEVMTRWSTARHHRREGRRPFVYEPPAEPPLEALRPEQVDPVARLRSALLERAAGLDEGESLSLADWLGDEELARDFTDAVFQLNLLSRIQGQDDDGALDLGRGVRVAVDAEALEAGTAPAGAPEGVLAELTRQGLLVRLPGRGLHQELRLSPLAEDGADHD